MIYYVVHTLIWLMLLSVVALMLLGMLVRLTNKCLFLTQLPTFPPITKCFAEKAIRGCAPKVLAETWTSAGPGLDRVWSWWLSNLE